MRSPAIGEKKKEKKTVNTHVETCDAYMQNMLFQSFLKLRDFVHMRRLSIHSSVRYVRNTGHVEIAKI